MSLTDSGSHPCPWNKGIIVGQKRPLMPRHVWSIRARLELGPSIRDLVLFNLAVDSKLRACDLVRLRLEDIGGAGHIHERATIVQQKTGRAVRFEMASTAFSLVEPIRTCFMHGAVLVQVANRQSVGDHDHDFSLAIADALEEWQTLITSPVIRDLSMFEQYLLGRLGFTDRISVPLADELGITEVTKLAQHMGNHILHGREAIVSDMNDLSLWAAEDAGFKVLQDGEGGVARFVRDAYERAVADGEQGMSNALFGNFHYFLNSNASFGLFGTVKQMIIDCMSELLPYGPGDTPIFGVVAKRRYWHTFISAEREYGLPFRTIKKFAERAGVVDRLKTRGLIDAKALDELLRGDDALENHFNAASRLGAFLAHFEAFEEADLLHPVLRGEHKHNSTYRLGDLIRLEEALSRYANPQSGEVEGMVSMRQAYVETDWSLVDVVKHVVAGNVACSSVIGMKPVESIRLDLSALRALHPFAGVETLTVTEAAAMLGVGETVISKLIATHRISGFRQRHPDRNGRRWVASRDELEDFRGKYIPASEIWRRGIPVSLIGREMAAHGIVAQFPPDELRCTFYLREQVDQALSTA